MEAARGNLIALTGSEIEAPEVAPFRVWFRSRHRSGVRCVPGVYSPTDGHVVQ